MKLEINEQIEMVILEFINKVIEFDRLDDDINKTISIFSSKINDFVDNVADVNLPEKYYPEIINSAKKQLAFTQKQAKLDFKKIIKTISNFTNHPDFQKTSLNDIISKSVDDYLYRQYPILRTRETIHLKPEIQIYRMCISYLRDYYFSHEKIKENLLFTTDFLKTDDFLENTIKEIYGVDISLII